MARAGSKKRREAREKRAKARHGKPVQPQWPQPQKMQVTVVDETGMWPGEAES